MIRVSVGVMASVKGRVRDRVSVSVMTRVKVRVRIWG